MFILDYIVDLGPAVMMPVIFLVFGLAVGLKFSRALKSGLMVGIGFIGLNITIQLLTENLGPAATRMVENSGLNFFLFFNSDISRKTVLRDTSNNNWNSDKVHFFKGNAMQIDIMSCRS